MKRWSHKRQFGHVYKKAINAPIRKSDLIQIEERKKSKRRLKEHQQKQLKRTSQQNGGIKEYDFGDNKMAETNTFTNPNQSIMDLQLTPKFWDKAWQLSFIIIIIIGKLYTHRMDIELTTSPSPRRLGSGYYIRVM